MGRSEFLVELPKVWEPGDHLSAIGPTKRGKSTILGELVPKLPQFNTVVILTPKGRDQAFAGLGHETRAWPPRRPLGETMKILTGTLEDRHTDSEQKVWRLHIPINSEEDWPRLKLSYAKVLKSVIRRKEGHPNKLLVLVDETRYLADPKLLGLAPQISSALIMGRSKNASIINSFQAPRWIPRECLDQIVHGLIWRNRDRDVAKRLADISGVIDPTEFLAVSRTLDFHEFIWVNGASDNWYIVAAR